MPATGILDIICHRKVRHRNALCDLGLFSLTSCRTQVFRHSAQQTHHFQEDANAAHDASLLRVP